jgi:hypothetical protein
MIILSDFLNADKIQQNIIKFKVALEQIYILIIIIIIIMVWMLLITVKKLI